MEGKILFENGESKLQKDWNESWRLLQENSQSQLQKNKSICIFVKIKFKIKCNILLTVL